jgi:hypothetical protein
MADDARQRGAKLGGDCSGLAKVKSVTRYLE